MFQKGPVYKVQAASLFQVSNRKAAGNYLFFMSLELITKIETLILHSTFNKIRYSDLTNQ
jgi:hypothetical protein